MEAETAPELPQEGGSVRGGRVSLSSLVAKAVGSVRPGGFARSSGDRRESSDLTGGGARAPLQFVSTLWPPTPFAIAVAVVAVAIGFIAAVSYYSAREFSGRAADTRASNEAMSFAAHSARLANGDAFSGYIQILRYAEDPVVTAKYAEPNARQNALQQLLYLNTNKFDSLTIADRTGIIFATTDSRIATMQGSVTFAETRANLSPANSDIMLPEAGKPGYVEYTAPLRDVDGSIWGILVGRADPARLWRETLLAGVDGGQNVIINNSGQYAAGVPDELLRLPWHGQPLPNGAVRASIAGVDSICGLAPIGKDTQIDRGLNVASCLPASIIQAEQNDATGKQALITLAAAVLAIVAAAALLRVAWRRALAAGGAPAAPLDARVAPIAVVEAVVEAGPVVEEPAAVEEAEAAPVPELEPVVQLPPPDIDAVTLIDAYEARNARLAGRLREQLQAKLLIATTQADEAYKLMGADDELSSGLHAKAMSELETLREREIRSIGQELYPGLVRLGLPGALQAMKRELADVIDVRLEVDPSADSVSSAHGRAVLGSGIRLVLHRFVVEAVRTLALAGASECVVALEREGLHLTLRVSGRPADGEVVDPEALAANAISIEAYAGTLEIGESAAGIVMTARAPAPPVTEAPLAEAGEGNEGDPRRSTKSPAATLSEVHEGEEDEDDDGEWGDPVEEEPVSTEAAPAGSIDDDGDDDAVDEDDASLMTAFAAKPVAVGEDGPARAFSLDAKDGDELIAAFGPPSRGVAGELELVQTELFGSLIVALEIADNVVLADERDETSAHARALVRQAAKATLLALKAVDAEKASVSALLDGRMLVVSIASEGGERPALLGEVELLRDAIVASDGLLLVSVEGAAVEVTVRVPSDAPGDGADA